MIDKIIIFICGVASLFVGALFFSPFLKEKSTHWLFFLLTGVWVGICVDDWMREWVLGGKRKKASSQDNHPSQPQPYISPKEETVPKSFFLEQISLKEQDIENMLGDFNALLQKNIELQAENSILLQQISETELEENIGNEAPATRFITYNESPSEIPYGYQWFQERVDSYFSRFRNFKISKEMKKELGLLYERFIGAEYFAMNYNVKFNGALKGVRDGGIDLIAWNRQEILLIQCKYWKRTRPIPDAILTQFYGDIAYYKFCNPSQKNVHGIFITSKNNPSQHFLKMAELFSIKVVTGKNVVIPFPIVKLKGKTLYFPDDMGFDAINLTKAIPTFMKAKDFVYHSKKTTLDKRQVLETILCECIVKYR